MVAAACFKTVVASVLSFVFPIGVGVTRLVHFLVKRMPVILVLWCDVNKERAKLGFLLY